MKRSSRLLIGIVAAAATFASLTVGLGTEHWNYSGYHHHGHHYGRWEDCDHESPDYVTPPEDSAPESTGE